jgi:hypothetical protein
VAEPYTYGDIVRRMFDGGSGVMSGLGTAFVVAGTLRWMGAPIAISLFDAGLTMGSGGMALIWRYTAAYEELERRYQAALDQEAEERKQRLYPAHTQDPTFPRA